MSNKKRYIKIPRGINVYGTEYVYDKNHCFGLDTSKPKSSTRDMVVEFCWMAQEPYNWDRSNGTPYPKIVMWSQGQRWAYKKDVEMDVDAPAPKAVSTKTPKLSMRQRMIKGSKWKLTAPATVVKAGNPVNRGNWVEYFPVPDYDLPVGTEFEVTGKSATSYHFSNASMWGFFPGLWIPIRVAGSKDIIHVELKELNKNPEQLGEAPKVFIYAIYDTAQEKYYKDYTYDYYAKTSASPLLYETSISKAKKFKRLADARVHCLIQTGYYCDLPEAWGSIPDWMCGRKVFDVPATWVIHKINKATKQVEETIELLDTFNRSWNLRALTVEYNSAVRAIYSDLEKKGKLDQYSAMLMFKRNSDNRWDNMLTEEDNDAIKALISRYSGDDAKIHKTSTGFAVAMKDVSTATMIYLTYAGDLTGVIIDFTTMKALVQ